MVKDIRGRLTGARRAGEAQAQHLIDELTDLDVITKKFTADVAKLKNHKIDEKNKIKSINQVF